MLQKKEDEVLVSIICKTYNHKAYIESALQGFISQKTTFRFEVLVHDDASTDGTTAIVKKYADLYPDIIFPIIQTVNQYRKNIDISQKYILPKAKGKYIAVCEGDDYWCDKLKLQKQVDFLEKHYDYSSCCSNSYVIDVRTGEKTLFNSRVGDCDLSLEDVVLKMGSESYQSASLLYRKELEFMWREEQPPIFGLLDHAGDYPMRIYLLLKGKTRYFSDVMTVYRKNVLGSWSDRQNRKSDGEKVESYFSMIKCLRAVDLYTEYKCHDGIERDINEYEKQIADLTGDFALYRKALTSQYNPERNVLKTKIKIILGHLYEIHWKNEYEKRMKGKKDSID